MKVLLFSLASLLSAQVVGATAASFESAWDQGWQAHHSDKGCQMGLALPGYGEARFVADTTTDITFELQAMRDFQGGPLKVWRAAPAWLPVTEADAALGHLAHIPQGGSIAQGELAQQMFLALRQGYGLELRGPSSTHLPQDLELSLSALKFFPAMQSFLSCAHTSVTVAWQGISRTSVSFEVDAHHIEESPRLDAVATYVKSNPAVTRIYIDGHTDNSGAELANYLLAKRRAEAVHAYLQRAGITAPEVVVRYHGERYPIASNADAAGRAQNRRATVRLERGKERTDLAAKT